MAEVIKRSEFTAMQAELDARREQASQHENELRLARARAVARETTDQRTKFDRRLTRQLGLAVIACGGIVSVIGALAMALSGFLLIVALGQGPSDQSQMGRAVYNAQLASHWIFLVAAFGGFTVGVCVMLGGSCGYDSAKR